MEPQKKLLMIVNPRAGRSKPRGPLYDAAAALCDAGYLLRIRRTTAAGDAYIGAMASSLVRGENLEQGMRLATKTAALTITRQGAQQSIPTLDEVEAYFREEKGSRENQ